MFNGSSSAFCVHPVVAARPYPRLFIPQGLRAVHTFAFHGGPFGCLDGCRLGVPEPSHHVLQ
eukprot:2347658-Prorocentrum_lima.AAC.1